MRKPSKCLSLFFLTEVQIYTRKYSHPIYKKNVYKIKIEARGNTRNAKD